MTSIATGAVGGIQEPEQRHIIAFNDSHGFLQVVIVNSGPVGMWDLRLNFEKVDIQPSYL